MAKIVKCKTCGAEIAKTANVCPHCGGKQHTGAKVACVIIVLFAFFSIIGVIAGTSDTTASNGDVGASSSSASDTVQDTYSEPKESKKEEVIEVSAEDLYAAYKENTVNADALYKNKTLSVTGMITNIGQDAITKKPCVNLSVGDDFDFYPIQCFFGKSSDELAALRDGDVVTITGKCIGYSVFFVQLSSCELSE